MQTPRLILAALLLATPLLIARQAAGQPAEAKTAADQGAAQSQQASNLPDQAFRITVTFRNTEKGKTTTQKSYTLVAMSAAQRNSRPGVRDDSRVSGMAEPSGLSAPYFNTDVDVAEFKIAGNSVYLDLRISTDEVLDNPAAPQPDTHPIIRSRHYTVTPTLPVGKLVTVYSAVDAVNDSKVEIQALVQPLDAK